MRFEDTPRARLGALGEKIVDEYLIGRGLVPYKPIISVRHPFDRMVATADKKKIFIAETKTKKARTQYPDTGINVTAYDDYKRIYSEHRIDTFLFFIDAGIGKIYGNTLTVLDETREVSHNGMTLNYPWVHFGIRFFPLQAMKVIATLSDIEARELGKFY